MGFNWVFVENLTEQNETDELAWLEIYFTEIFNIHSVDHIITLVLIDFPSVEFNSVCVY